jgi:hypothetical protein
MCLQLKEAYQQFIIQKGKKKLCSILYTIKFLKNIT